MRIKNSIPILIAYLLLSFLILSGCATIIKGYEDRVDLIDAPDDIQVYSEEGVELPVSVKMTRVFNDETKKYQDQELNKVVFLRSNQRHILILKSGDKEKVISVYPKIGAGWLIVDIITGVVPAIIDAYTGNWSHFEPIIIDF
jgi:hypothetical protein